MFIQNKKNKIHKIYYENIVEIVSYASEGQDKSILHAFTDCPSTKT